MVPIHKFSRVDDLLAQKFHKTGGFQGKETYTKLSAAQSSCLPPDLIYAFLRLMLFQTVSLFVETINEETL